MVLVFFHFVPQNILHTWYSVNSYFISSKMATDTSYVYALSIQHYSIDFNYLKHVCNN